MMKTDRGQRDVELSIEKFFNYLAVVTPIAPRTEPDRFQLPGLIPLPQGIRVNAKQPGRRPEIEEFWQGPPSYFRRSPPDPPKNKLRYGKNIGVL